MQSRDPNSYRPLSYDEFFTLTDWITKVKNLSVTLSTATIQTGFSLIGRMRLMMAAQLDLGDQYLTQEACIYYGWHQGRNLQQLIDSKIFSSNPTFDNSGLYALIQQYLDRDQTKDLCFLLKTNLPDEFEIRSWTDKFPYLTGISIDTTGKNACTSAALSLFRSCNDTALKEYAEQVEKTKQLDRYKKRIGINPPTSSRPITFLFNRNNYTVSSSTPSDDAQIAKKHLL